MAKLIYNETFYQGQRVASSRSSSAVVPILLELVQPNSVVDVGCGMGTWLSTFAKLGVTDVLGIDGDHVNRGCLEIPKEAFMSMDLANIPASLSLPEKELATCFEVAEHIPQENEDRLLNLLSRLAPVVCFSAAIPGQGGANHVNEQWPDYWSAKFAERGFACFDIIRPAIWDKPEVEPWYSQNSFLYVRKECLANYPKVLKSNQSIPPRLVHPELFNRFVSMEYISTMQLTRELARRVKRKVLRMRVHRPTP